MKSETSFRVLFLKQHRKNSLKIFVSHQKVYFWILAFDHRAIVLDKMHIVQCSDICSYLPRYLRNSCASREGCDGRWGAGLGRGGRRGGQRQRHPSRDRHHDHGQQCHLDNHYHHQVDFSVREHTERSKAVWSTASFQLKLVRTLFFIFFFLLFIQIFIFFLAVQDSSIGDIVSQ